MSFSEQLVPEGATICGGSCFDVAVAIVGDAGRLCEVWEVLLNLEKIEGRLKLSCPSEYPQRTIKKSRTKLFFDFKAIFWEMFVFLREVIYHTIVYEFH